MQVIEQLTKQEGKSCIMGNVQNHSAAMHARRMPATLSDVRM